MVHALALIVFFAVAVNAARAADSPVLVPPVSDAAPQDPPLKEWLAPVRQLTVQLPGMSHHFSKPKDRHGHVMAGREYNEQNWGAGLQFGHSLTGDWEHWITKTSFGVMKDSLNAMGVYAGHTWQKRLVDEPAYNVDLGGGGFLFYRTLRFDGPHVFVPAVLPVLSAEHKATRFGANIVLVPQCRVSGGIMPAVLYVQFTKAF